MVGVAALLGRYVSLTRNDSSAHDRILDAAGALFAERGYDGVSIADIAGASDISTGLVYYHFKDKATLYESVVHQGLQLLEETAAQALGAEGTPTERIRTFVLRYMELLEGHPALMRLLIRSVTDLSGPAPGHVLKRSGVTVARLQSVIADGIAAGEFKKTDARLAATALFALVNTLITARVLDTPLGETGGASIQEHAEFMTRLFLEGIAACS